MKRVKLTPVDVERAFAEGHRAGHALAKAELVAERTQVNRRLEFQRLETQAIDAISHAVTALARLIDGRDAR